MDEDVDVMVARTTVNEVSKVDDCTLCRVVLGEGVAVVAVYVVTEEGGVVTEEGEVVTEEGEVVAIDRVGVAVVRVDLAVGEVTVKTREVNVHRLLISLSKTGQYCMVL